MFGFGKKDSQIEASKKKAQIAKNERKASEERLRTAKNDARAKQVTANGSPHGMAFWSDRPAAQQCRTKPGAAPKHGCGAKNGSSGRGKH